MMLFEIYNFLKVNDYLAVVVMPWLNGYTSV